MPECNFCLMPGKKKMDKAERENLTCTFHKSFKTNFFNFCIALMASSVTRVRFYCIMCKKGVWTLQNVFFFSPIRYFLQDGMTSFSLPFHLNIISCGWVLMVMQECDFYLLRISMLLLCTWIYNSLLQFIFPCLNFLKTLVKFGHLVVSVM